MLPVFGIEKRPELAETATNPRVATKSMLPLSVASTLPPTSCDIDDNGYRGRVRSSQAEQDATQQGFIFHFIFSRL
ncbi:MAG: hypothetical protein ACI9DC_004368 [Gammaproteobacteria bacterium]